MVASDNVQVGITRPNSVTAAMRAIMARGCRSFLIKSALPSRA